MQITLVRVRQAVEAAPACFVPPSPAKEIQNPSKTAKNRPSAAASRFKLTAMAVRNAWMRMFCRSRLIARASPCQHFASPWKPSDRQR